MQPGAVNDDVIRNTVWFHADESGSISSANRAGDLQPDQAIVIGAGAEDEGPVSCCVVFNPGHYILPVDTEILRASRQGRHAGIARRHTLTLGRQKTVGCAGADDDPMTAIAVFGPQKEPSREDRACLQLNRVAAKCVV